MTVNVPDDKTLAAADPTAAPAPVPEQADSAAGLLGRIADRITARATVQSVYGDPVEHGGVTVIPVARVAFGFGGGAGRGHDPTHSGEGGGGGGGVEVRPLGFIEMRDGSATFRPIRAPWVETLVPLLTIAVAAAPGIARALRGRGR